MDDALNMFKYIQQSRIDLGIPPSSITLEILTDIISTPPSSYYESLTVVNSEGLVLKYINPIFKDYRIYTEAIINNPTAIQFIEVEDKELLR